MSMICQNPGLVQARLKNGIKLSTDLRMCGEGLMEALPFVRVSCLARERGKKFPQGFISPVVLPPASWHRVTASLRVVFGFRD